MTEEISKEMWCALDGVEEAINKLLAVRDVVSLNILPNEEIVKLIDAMVNHLSEKQKVVWDEYRKQQEIHDPEFAKHYRQLTNDYIELETKYKKLALYDTRDQHIEDLTKENTELIRQIEEMKANTNPSLNSEEYEKLNQQIKELVIQNEFYKDKASRFNQECDYYSDECERWESKYARLKEDYDNLTNTVRNISQHPSHD